jgi:hypothetical protein
VDAANAALALGDRAAPVAGLPGDVVAGGCAATACDRETEGFCGAQASLGGRKDIRVVGTLEAVDSRFRSVAFDAGVVRVCVYDTVDAAEVGEYTVLEPS